MTPAVRERRIANTYPLGGRNGTTRKSRQRPSAMGSRNGAGSRTVPGSLPSCSGRGSGGRPDDGRGSRGDLSPQIRDGKRGVPRSRQEMHFPDASGRRVSEDVRFSKRRQVLPKISRPEARGNRSEMASESGLHDFGGIPGAGSSEVSDTSLNLRIARRRGTFCGRSGPSGLGFVLHGRRCDCG